MSRVRDFALLFVLVKLSLGSMVYADQCGMKMQYTLSGAEIYSATTGVSSLYYKTDMDVNTDGAARSYHPNDPRGKSIAYNNMGNAITKAWSQSGKRITCDKGKATLRRGRCFDEYISAFEGARDNNYHPDKFPRIETKYIIPWSHDERLGWPVPCTIKTGANKGFFVSQTSLWLQKGDKCEPSNYVDSLSINAVVYPKGVKWSSRGVYTDKGDLVVTRNTETGIIAFALHGDAGPSNKIGEGTIALTAELLGKTVPSDATYSEIRKLAVPNVEYLIFPANDVEKYYRNKGGVTQSRINEYGAKVFADWGGIERLDTCARK